MPLNFAEALTRAQGLPVRFQAFQSALNAIARAWSFALTTLGALLGVFLVHALFTWASDDPEKAFDRGTFLLEVIELSWDLTGMLWNTGADVANAAAIPLWNAFSFYVVEPSVTLTLEVFSLVFLRHRWKGVISEEQFEYGGFICDPDSVASSTFCGRFGAYSDRLSKSGSQTVTDSITFGVATARRLSELADDELVVPTIETADLIGALDGLSTQSIVMGASGFDVFFAVLYEVFETSAVFIFDALFIIAKTLFDIIKLLIKSGMLQTLIGIGVDFIVIVAIEIGLPLLFAALDAVVCGFQFFLIDTWPEQLQCAEEKCFKGPDAAADLWLFSSVPQVVERFSSILEATLNSRTGRSFTGGGEVDLGISSLPNVFPSLAGSGCANCFACKFPELRYLWFVTAISVSLLNPANFDRYYGDVTRVCLSDGSYFTDTLCGPRGATADLSFNAWRSRYTGYAEFDVDIVQSFAGLLAARAEQMGGVAGGEDATMAKQAAEAWFFRDPSLPDEQQAAQFTYFACKIWRNSDAQQGLSDSAGNFDQFAKGSLAQITTKWAYETCKFAKSRVFGDISRSIHSFALEVSMCFEDQVACKKGEEECRGGCSGDISSTLHYDFSTRLL